MWLHGFTQTRHSAQRFRTILAGRHELMTLDLPGHGENASVQTNLAATADLIAESVPAEKFHLAGYSLGARVALHLAIRHPSRLGRLVLIGASRGIQDETERERRIESDRAWASVLRNEGIEIFLTKWLAQPLFSTLTSSVEELASRSRNADALARSLELVGAGTQEWLEPHLSSLSVPTLALAGALDHKFGREAHAIATGVGDGRAVLIDGAGHAAHVEQPDASAALVCQFLD